MPTLKEQLVTYRADEQAMAQKIAAGWDNAAMESLRQEGVELPEQAAA